MIFGAEVVGPTDSHTFLAFGLFAAIVLGAAAVAISAYNSFCIHQMRDQIEQAADEATPSMASALDDDGPGEDSYRAPQTSPQPAVAPPPPERRTDEMAIGDEIEADIRAHVVHDGSQVASEPATVPRKATEAREFGGHTFRFAVESPGADESPREAEAVQGVRGGGPVRRPSPTPRRAVPGASVPDAPQRPEA